MAVRNKNGFPLDNNPLWYKDAIFYQLHVRAFYDSTGDGMGDFGGLSQKLDYLQDLGVTAIWLLPFYPSPLRDDGYDIADYAGVHPIYGTLTDFKHFLREAHRRGLRVVTELVVNHTSDQHPWFQRARRSPPGSPWRDFYVWSDTPDKYKEARIIFKDFEPSNWTWDHVANAYYWHRFYAHQPDLNYDNPEVHKAIFQAMEFWLDMGIDGLRLDAVPYLYQREGTNCENLPETHAFLKKLRRHVDERYPNRMLLAEANQWPEDAVGYFGEGDECHTAFHFPVMPRMFMAGRMEDRYPIIDIMSQTPPIPETCQWVMFLRNHDELTLEMVTDEERDYMYRAYAHDPQARINLGIRRRLAPLLGKDRRKIELMNGLLFSLPGTPVIYYGDEIGMGDNIYLGDRNGVRTPMQWTADRNAGFSRANAQRLFLPVTIDPEFHYESVNVEARQNNPHSILWWMKRLIALRKEFRAFGWGSLEFLYPENHRVLAFIRRYREEVMLVVANLSRFAQYVELDLAEFKGMRPVELFGRTEFPLIGELTYLLTLGPHAFYWFSLEPQRVEEIEISAAGAEVQGPILTVAGSWETIFRKEIKPTLEKRLSGFLQTRRWFGGKARRTKSVEIQEAITVPHDASSSVIAFVQVEYTEGDPEMYVLPLSFAQGERADQIQDSAPHAILTRLATANGEGFLYEALRDPGLASALLETMARRRRVKGIGGEIAGTATRIYRRLRGAEEETLEPSLLRAEQSNTSVIFGNRFILKVFRRLDQGVNPDLEIGAFLTERTTFKNLPPVAGSLEYRRGQEAPMTLAVLQGLVPNEGDAWVYTLDALSRYYEQAAVQPVEKTLEWRAGRSPLDSVQEELPPLAQELIGHYRESAWRLGRRTAEMHLALASAPDDPTFAPEPFSPFYQRSLYQSMRNLTVQSLALLRRKLRDLPEDLQPEAQRVADLEKEILHRFRAMLDRKITAMRTRIHGDYHLGQVLYTGNDFVIIDFEGEPARSISERRIKRSPLRDVGGMLRSFHYAAYSALLGRAAGRVVRPEDLPMLEPWANYWHLSVSALFLKSYLELAGEAQFLPHGREELGALLDTYLLEKAVYELAYELNNRPDWVRIPLRGILQLLETLS
jgi:maltose alpha-D-glucosyltransferase/alpha-amylase